MISPSPGHTAVPRLRGRSLPRLLAIGLASLLVMSLAPAAGAHAASTSALSLPAKTSKWAKIGGKYLTRIAEVTATVPAGALDLGLQFRAASRSVGYRTKVSIAADGTVTGSFSRVKSYSETAVGSSASLGFTVQPGDQLHLEATVAGKKPVLLYLRAWKEGTTKPTTWQLAATDSSSKRVQKAGYTNVWARTPAGSPTMTVAYTVNAVAAYSAARAKAVGTAPGQTSTSGSSTFSIAVIGDTQAETDVASDTRFGDRTAWLAANKDALDLRYVLHTGDVVDWGWLAPAQYTRAKAAMANLTKVGVPWSVTIGNHDSRAVGWNNVAGSTGYGGGPYMNNPECPTRLSAAECKSWLLIRKTDEFNASFPVSALTNLGGVYETGRIDNNWTSFTANDTKWLVLTLEFNPRAGAVAWAKDVVASHPDYNVIIETHHYLDGSGTVSTGNDGYGEKSPKYIFDQIVSQYSNVKIVVSGHTGNYASRTDTNDGNTVLSYLGNDLGSSDNPLRVLTIDTSTGMVNSTVYSKVAPSGVTTYKTQSNTISITR